LEILPKGKLLPKKGTIRVVFHPAIPFPGPSPEGMDAWMAAVRERLSVGSD
jgi:hypothetical protein